MDLLKRWAAGALINEAGFLLVHATSTLQRTYNWYKDGMTEKERAYLNRRIERAIELQQEMRKLSMRLNSTSGESRKLGAP